MAGRKIRYWAEARVCLAQAEASGLSRRDWARAQGVDARSLNMWRLLLERRQRPAEQAEPVRLVELVVEWPRPRPMARYIVHVGSVSLELDDGFEEETLRRLLRVVATC